MEHALGLANDVGAIRGSKMPAHYYSAPALCKLTTSPKPWNLRKPPSRHLFSIATLRLAVASITPLSYYSP